jgi:multiple antibiotic resistance protein
MSYDSFITDFMTLMVTIEPIGAIPVYLALTGGMNAADRHRVALMSCVIATAILLFFLVLGQILLEAIGISIAAFRLAGGLVLLTLGLRMIYGVGENDTTTQIPAKPRAVKDIIVFPMATPMLAGGGAITAIVVLTDNHQYSVFQQAATAATLLLVMVLSYLTLMLASPIQRLIGETGTNVVGRIMGLILTALAMQTFISALKTVLPPGTIL